MFPARQAGSVAEILRFDHEGKVGCPFRACLRRGYLLTKDAGVLAQICRGLYQGAKWAGEYADSGNK